ncbi:alkaline phosphatase D family protein [Streptomyces sp. B22F1]|uniref:alkaline phosphatase D family protein n=1 Tax=Streptomyces sp. B22F1 TaxID=3153566 RepID=UPI00325E425E
MTPPHPQDALRAAAAHVSRRRFLTVTGAAAALAFSVGLPQAHADEPADPGTIRQEPFTLGVASGDPAPDGVVLWTRLAPAAFEPDGGMPPAPFPVDWEIAHDEGFRRVVRRGRELAHPEFHHTVHAEVDGLVPGRPYYYRFRLGPWISPVGRTSTAPPQHARNSAMRFGVVACQNYPGGYYTAFKHLANEDLDAVFHLGDWIYEGAVASTGGSRAYPAGTLPAVFNHETVTLEDYRLRYALYRSDADLRAAQAAHPWILTWDDHEVENNYAGAISQDNLPPDEFLVRRAAAYRAYWENQPLRRPQRPRGADLRLYRRLHYGTLAQFDVLDGRQYRSDQAYGGAWARPGGDADDPARTMLGERQEHWLADGWRDSRARWNVVPQQVVLAERRSEPIGEYTVSMDAWDGYTAARTRFLDAAEAAGVENLVVLTGDVHVHYAMDVKRDYADPAAPAVASEIVATSISSGGNGAERPASYDRLTQANPHLRFYDGRRGYVTVALDREQCRADFRVVPYITTEGAPVATAASYAIEAGRPGLHRV